MCAIKRSCRTDDWLNASACVVVLVEGVALYLSNWKQLEEWRASLSGVDSLHFGPRGGAAGINLAGFGGAHGDFGNHVWKR